jgi:hypothetical protein
MNNIDSIVNMSFRRFCTRGLYSLSDTIVIEDDIYGA